VELMETLYGLDIRIKYLKESLLLLEVELMETNEELTLLPLTLLKIASIIGSGINGNEK